MKNIILSIILGFSVINVLAQTLSPYQDDSELYGYKNATGKVVIKPKYAYAYKFVEGLAVACDEAKKCGCINEKGKVVIPFIYDKPLDRDHSFSNGLIALSINWKFGFLDKEGKEVIPLKYKWVKNFNEDIAEVSEGYGNSSYREERYFIDKTGKRLFSTSDYSIVTGFKNGISQVVAIRKKMLYGYIDKTGKEIIPAKYELIIFQDDGYIRVIEDGKSGWLTKNYEVFIPTKYEYVNAQVDGCTVVEENGKYGCLNKNYELFIPTLYSNNQMKFSEGMGAVRLNNLWGFVDNAGKTVIPFQYDNVIEGFKNGIAKVELKDERFSIDMAGKKIDGTTTVVKKAPVREIMTDVDGKKYFTTKIGDQTWMASNLTVEHFRNGDPIEIVTDKTTWKNTKAGAASFYENNKDLSFGTELLYNMNTVTDSRNVCPVGWHLPTPEESRILINTVAGGETFLTGLNDDANGRQRTAIMAIKSTALWDANDNLAGTNSSGFNLAPTGMRDMDGTFRLRGNTGYFWMVNKANRADAQVFMLIANLGINFFDSNNANTALGYPIRCIKD